MMSQRKWHNKNPFLLKGLISKHIPKFCAPELVHYKLGFNLALLSRVFNSMKLNIPNNLYVLHIDIWFKNIKLPQ